MSYIHYSWFDSVHIHNLHPLFIDDARIVHLIFVYFSSLEVNRTSTILLCLLYNIYIIYDIGICIVMHILR
jgi:hypothetical protein